jgi:hypothetical protein
MNPNESTSAPVEKEAIEKEAESYADKYSCPSSADRSDIIEHFTSGAEAMLKKHASFEFEQWKKDHPQGFKIVERAMNDYAKQQNQKLQEENARLRSLIDKAYFKDHDPEQDLIRNRVMQKAWEQFKKDNNL